MDSQGFRPNHRQATSGSRYVGRPTNIIELLDLREIKERFGVGVDRIYRAVALGHLRAYGRPGRQKYYSASEIEAWLSSSVGGRQLSFGEFTDDILSA